MQTSKTYFPKQNAIHVAFSPDRLETLISQGKLHAADFNCLDKKSKRTVWEHAARRRSSQIELIMNLNRAERAETWCEAVILAANEQLESMYRQHASACLALQISRNYRLLLTHNEHPLKKQHWRALSQRWLLSYQLHRGQQRGLPDMLESL